MQTILETQSLANTSLQELMREMLVRLGEDPERDGLLHTPERMERSLHYLGAMFDVAYDEMVIVKDIEMFSLCEHHLLPFFGKVHVAYIPRGKVIGLSKVPRLVDEKSETYLTQAANRCAAQPRTHSGGCKGGLYPVRRERQPRRHRERGRRWSRNSIPSLSYTRCTDRSGLSH